jgi:multidrug efflux pump subunit AcrA (membrane-fusion protein)
MRQLLLFAILVLGLCSCSGNKTQKEPTPVSVKTEKVNKINGNMIIKAGGTVTAQDAPSKVSFTISGRIIAFNPREGDYVNKGDTIAVLDSEDYQLAFTRAEAQAEVAEAVFEKASGSARPEELERAKIAYERADDEHRRMKMLYDSGSLAPNDYLKFKAMYDSALQQYEIAKNGAQAEDKKQAEATLKQAKALRDTARKSLNDTRLKAPISGYISKRFAEKGETVAAGQPIVEIVRLDKVDVSAGVPEKDIRHIVKDGKATVRISALNKNFEGRVRVVNVSAEPSTRTYLTKIELDNPEQLLKIGMAANVEIESPEAIDVMTVPVTALVSDLQGATAVFVYYPSENRVYSIKVETGRFFDQSIEITKGLKGDEEIVVAGQSRLRDGVLVNISAE